ncbi:MAG: hypothetical protein JXR22_01265 [Prolixibacteraceae bacterium]|nr:hypothetical protein [Prolixibacteraceae bacterium]
MADIDYTVLVQYIQQLFDSDLTGFDMDFIRKQIDRRKDEWAESHQGDYLNYLKNNFSEAEMLYQSLFIGYSTFFRNLLTFSVLEQIIVPEIIFNKRNKKSNEIRIWSAACAGGQEVYSMAMVVEEYNSGKEKIAYRILGTDQHEKQINLARIGAYSDASMANVRIHQLERWFVSNGNSFAVIPELQKNITFSVFDLFGEQYSTPPESIFGGFDIVLCANLLFYYQADYQKIIIDKIRGSMAQNGYLITGETERDIVQKHGFKEVFPHSAIFQER